MASLAMYGRNHHNICSKYPPIKKRERGIRVVEKPTEMFWL